MNKQDRFRAALRGDAVDHAPCTAWLHFATDYLPGKEAARRHAVFARHYDWDICKAMHDYRYPMPEGLETLETANDMLRFTRLPPHTPNYVEQLDLVRSLRADLGPDWPIVDTFFDPFQQVMRRVGYGKASLVYQHPREALHMLDAVTETVCAFLRELRSAGCDGVLYSINGAIAPPGDRGIDDATFKAFLRPFDLRVLEAMEGMARILHVHGTHVDMRRVLDYPCEAFSVSDRLPGNPSLAQLRGMTDKCLMGGIDEQKIIERSLPDLRAEMHDAVAQVGTRNFILAPGCTIPPQTPEHILRCVRQTSRELTGD